MAAANIFKIEALRVKLEERDNRIATLEMESQAWTSKSAQQAKDSAECLTLVKEELDLTRASLDTAADECRGLIMKLDERNREMRSKTLEVQKLKDQNALLTERLQLAETDVQKTTAIKDGMEEDTRRMVTEIERQLGLECAERSHLQRQNDILSDMLDVTQDELTRAEIELEIYRIQAAGKDSPRSKKERAKALDMTPESKGRPAAIVASHAPSDAAADPAVATDATDATAEAASGESTGESKSESESDREHAGAISSTPPTAATDAMVSAADAALAESKVVRKIDFGDEPELLPTIPGTEPSTVIATASNPTLIPAYERDPNHKSPWTFERRLIKERHLLKQRNEEMSEEVRLQKARVADLEFRVENFKLLLQAVKDKCKEVAKQNSAIAADNATLRHQAKRQALIQTTQQQVETAMADWKRQQNLQAKATKAKDVQQFGTEPTEREMRVRARLLGKTAIAPDLRTFFFGPKKGVIKARYARGGKGGGGKGRAADEEGEDGDGGGAVGGGLAGEDGRGIDSSSDEGSIALACVDLLGSLDAGHAAHLDDHDEAGAGGGTHRSGERVFEHPQLTASPGGARKVRTISKVVKKDAKKEREPVEKGAAAPVATPKTPPAPRTRMPQTPPTAPSDKAGARTPAWGAKALAKRSPKRTPGHASPKKVPRQRSAAPGTAAKAAATKEESPVDSNVAAAAEIRLKAAAKKEAKATAETAAAAAPKAKKVVDKVPAWKKAFQESLKAEKRSRVDNRAAEQRRKRDFNAAQLALELKRKEAEKRKALRRKADKAKFELPDAGGASTRRDAEAAELQAGGAVDTAANPLQITRPPLSSGNPLSSPPPPPKGSSNSPLHKSGKKDRGGAAPSPSASGLARHRGRGAASTGAAPAKSPQMSTVESFMPDSGTTSWVKHAASSNSPYKKGKGALAKTAADAAKKTRVAPQTPKAKASIVLDPRANREVVKVGGERGQSHGSEAAAATPLLVDDHGELYTSSQTKLLERGSNEDYATNGFGSGGEATLFSSVDSMRAGRLVHM